MKHINLLLILLLCSSFASAQIIKNLNACIIADGHDLDTSLIINYAKDIIKYNYTTVADDKCMFYLLDTMVNRINNNKQYYLFTSLNALAENSNEPLFSELFPKMMDSLFHTSFNPLFQYLYKIKDSKNKQFENFLIEGLSLEVTKSGNLPNHNTKKELERVKRYIDIMAHKYHYNNDQSNYLNYIKSKINPKCGINKL